jgi:hypothetical protein
MRLRLFAAALLLVFAGTTAAYAQSDPTRDQTREQVREVLLAAGPRSDVNITFRQSTKQPYNFTGSRDTGLTYAESLEIVVSVSDKGTVHFRVYPHYKGGYINVAKVRDPNGLMKKLLYFSDQNFLYWGADDSGDCFSGYTFTLESGFPREAIIIVLRSIKNTDGFVGDLRPFIDGPA